MSILRKFPSCHNQRIIYRKRFDPTVQTVRYPELCSDTVQIIRISLCIDRFISVSTNSKVGSKIVVLLLPTLKIAILFPWIICQKRSNTSITASYWESCSCTVQIRQISVLKISQLFLQTAIVIKNYCLIFVFIKKCSSCHTVIKF